SVIFTTVYKAGWDLNHGEVVVRIRRLLSILVHPFCGELHFADTSHILIIGLRPLSLSTVINPTLSNALRPLDAVLLSMSQSLQILDKFKVIESLCFIPQ